MVELRRLRRDLLDDLSATRTLARAEAAFLAPPRPSAADRLRRGLVPAALALWGALYVFRAVVELGRLFPA